MGREAPERRQLSLNIGKYAPQFVRHLTIPTSKNNEVIRMLCVRAFNTHLTVQQIPRTVKISPLCSFAARFVAHLDVGTMASRRRTPSAMA